MIVERDGKISLVECRTLASATKRDTWALFSSYQQPEYRKCSFCKALLFPHEPDSFCCQQGNVGVALPKMVTAIRDLLCGMSSKSAYFREHIRSYNCLLAFTSNGVQLDSIDTTPTGIYTLRIQGAFCHRMRSIIPGIIINFITVYILIQLPFT